MRESRRATNHITKLQPATSEDEEADPNRGLRVSAKHESCSDQVMAEGPVDVSMGDGTMSVVLVDTPGVPDTQGRGVQFLEIILPFVKENPVHGIVFVVNASRRLSAELKLCVRAMKECFNGMLTESRLIIHVNKLPTDFELVQKELDRMMKA